MKTLGFCLLILSLSVLQLKAAIDYTSPTATWSTTPACTTEDGLAQSPVKFTNDRCGPYESFSINLPAATGTAFAFDGTTSGAFKAAYTTGKITVEGRSFTTTNIYIRVPAEHQLPNALSTKSMEVQIELTPSDGKTTPGFFSFIMFSDENNQGITNSLSSLAVVTAFGTTATPSVDLNLDKLTSAINSKISSGLFLNIFTYMGTSTGIDCTKSMRYVYGSPLAIDKTVYANAVTAVAAGAAGAGVTLTSGGGNNRPIGVANGGKGTLAATRLCYTGYFKNYMNYNYGLWFGVTIIVGWFIVNLMLGEKPIKDTEYQENTWTNHPLYSIYHIGNDLFTRKTRMSLLLGTITIHALFSSVWYRRTSEENRGRGSNIIVYAVYSMLVDWAFIFIIGSMLRGYYIAKHQYYKTRDEGWQQKSQNRLFAFYFCIFLLAAILWPFTVWNMGELHPEKDQKASDYWVASFFVGLGLELLVADPLICILAKSITPLRNFIKNRGYFYDHICHETYLDHLKVD